MIEAILGSITLVIGIVTSVGAFTRRSRLMNRLEKEITFLEKMLPDDVREAIHVQIRETVSELANVGVFGKATRHRVAAIVLGAVAVAAMAAAFVLAPFWREWGLADIQALAAGGALVLVGYIAAIFSYVQVRRMRKEMALQQEIAYRDKISKRLEASRRALEQSEAAEPDSSAAHVRSPLTPISRGWNAVRGAVHRPRDR